MEKNRIVTRISFCLFLLCIGLAYLAWNPRNMDQFNGYGEEAMGAEEAERFSRVVRQKIKEGKGIKISEYDLNRYLNAVFKLEHSRLARPWVGINGIYVDLNPDNASICIERDIHERLHQSAITIEVRVEEEQTESQYSKRLVIRPRNGTIGKLKVPSRLAASLNGWYNTFSGETADLLRSLGLHKCDFEIFDGELAISPPKTPVF